MAYILQFLLLSLWSQLIACESLAEAYKRRSDAYLVYANNYSDDYEPVAYAALPLHHPMPVLHMLSTKPLAGLQGLPGHRPTALASNIAPIYARPYDSYHPYAAESYIHPYAENYPSETRPRPQSNPTEILMARPDKYGGYTYYKKPMKSKPQVNKRPKRPVILRIHKYRIRDDDK